MAEHAPGRAERSQAVLEALMRDHDKGAAYQIAEAHAWRGETDEAFARPQRAFERNDGGLSFVQVDPFPASLVDDPRYAALLQELGLERGPMGSAR